LYIRGSTRNLAMKYVVKLPALLFIISSISLQAQTHSWTGNGGDMDWFNASNWDVNAVPDATSDVLITTGFVVEITTAAATANSVQIEATGMLIIQNNFAITTSAIVDPQGAFVFKEGVVNITGTLTNNGTFKFNGPNLKRLENAVLENNGLILVAESNVTQLLNVTINNNSAATLDIASVGGMIQQNNNSVINNFGLLRKRADGINPIGNFYVITEIMNEGTIDVAQDEILLLLASQSDFINTPTGVIQGSGTLDITTDFMNNGIISPAEDGGVGVLDFTNNFELSPSSMLHIDINGTTPGSYDVISIVGSPILDGSMRITTSTTDIEEGDQFTVITASNGISSCSLPDTIVEFDSDGDGLNIWEFDVQCNGNSVILETSSFLLSSEDILDETIEFFIHPNPITAKSQFQLPTKIDQNSMEITLYNTVGQQIKKLTTSVEIENFRPSEMGPGMYFAQLSAENEITATTRFIVH